MQPLTVKQQAFVDNYSDKDSETFGNATKSYIKAGYKNGVGVMQAACRELSKDKIKQAIKAYRAQIEQKTEVKREYVLQCIQDQYTKADEANDRASALRACELLGKSIAMFTDKYEDSTAEKPVSISKELIEELQQEAKNRLNSKDNLKLRVG